MATYSVGIVGATGAVGEEMIRVLEKRAFPLSTLRLFASSRSAGKKVSTAFGEVEIEVFTEKEVGTLDIVLLAVSGDFARAHAKNIMKGGAKVIDNSSAFRLEKEVPLVVPEINADAVRGHSLIANPNCTTAILAVALFPLHQHFGVQKVICSTYQATSGGGAPAMEELRAESKHFLAGEPVSCKKFAHPIPFNLIPHIDIFQENGYTKEEMKVTRETQKIFSAPTMNISCTAVRIPTFRAHAESVTIETKKDISPDVVRALLQKADGVELRDDLEKQKYPMPITATKKFDVEVGRIRQSLVFGKKGIDFFVCGDQLLKGAALNAVQIAELFVGEMKNT